MNLILSTLTKNIAPLMGEIRRYLQYAPNVVDPDIDRIIKSAIDEITENNQAQILWKIFPAKIEPESRRITIQGTNLAFTSKNLAEYLSNSAKIVIFAATLGLQADRLIKQYSYHDVTRSLILDATASAMIELVCDHVENMIRDTISRDEMYLSQRFSPGYGDLPITLQPDLLQILDAPKTIGLQASKSFQLLPMKSVTAFLGIKKTPCASLYSTPSQNIIATSPADACITCMQRERCYFRKKGERCEFQRRLETTQ